MVMTFDKEKEIYKIEMTFKICVRIEGQLIISMLVSMIVSMTNLFAYHIQFSSHESLLCY